MASKRRISRKAKWFIKVRGSYLPNSYQAWLSYVPYITYLLIVMIVALHYKHPLGTAILVILPFWLAGAMLMTWFAKQNS